MPVKIIRVGDGALPAFSSGVEFLSGALPQPPKVGLRHAELISLICKGYEDIYGGSTVNPTNSEPISLNENTASEAGVPKQANIQFPLSEENLNKTLTSINKVVTRGDFGSGTVTPSSQGNFPTDRRENNSQTSSPQGKTFTSGTDLYRTEENFTNSTIRVSNARTVHEITTREIAVAASQYLADRIAVYKSGIIGR